MMTSQAQDDQNPSDAKSTSHRRNPYLHVIAWIGATLAIIVVLGFGAVMALVNTSRGHRYLLGFVQRKAEDALGVRVQIENLTLHLTTLSADVYGIRVSGASPYANSPLLELDHLAAGVRVVSLLHRTWYLDNLQIDHPVAWLVVGKNGVSNLPVFKKSGSSHTDLFQLGIRHVEIARGEVYYNSRPYAISADLHNLAFNSTFSNLLTRYSGSLSYSQGSLSFGSYRPLRHDLEVEFAATPQMFTLYRGRVSAGPSSSLLSATVEGYNDPVVQAHYDVVLDGRQAAEILNRPTMPSGSVHLSGSLHYQSATNRSQIESLMIDGGVTSASLTWNTPAVHARLAKLSAHYSLANGNAVVRDARAEVLGGAVMANGTMAELGGNTHSVFHVELKNVSLAQAVQAFQQTAPRSQVSLNGAANATATVTWGKTINDLNGRADLILNGQAVRHQTGQQGMAAEISTGSRSAKAAVTVPIQGTLHAIYSNASHELTLNNSYLRSAQSNVSMNGTISRRSSLALQLQVNDLSEAATFADLFLPHETSANQIDLAGSASFHGVIRGSLAAPEISGQLAAENLEYHGTKWKVLRTGVDLSGAHAGLENLQLQAMGRGQITGSAGLGLQDWKFTSQSPVQLALNGSGLDVAAIAALAGRRIPITGSLSLQAHLHGEAIDPAGSSSITLSNATVFGEPVSTAKVEFTGSGSNLQATASVQLAAGTMQARATANPEAKTFTAQLNSSGIDLAKLHAVETRGIGVKGDLKIEARGQGTFSNPEVDATLEIPTLAIGGQVISQTRLRVNAANRVANVELDSSVANASLHGKAQVNLSGDYLTDASLDTQSVPLAPLLAAYEPEEGPGLTGQVEIHATVHGPLKEKNQLQLHVKVPILQIAYGKIQLAASPIQADLQNGTATLQPLTIRGTDTELSVQGAYPLGHQAPASLKVQGAVNLQVMQIFDPELHASGQLKVNFDSRSTDPRRLLDGEIDIADANLSTDSSPVGLQHGNGVLKINNDRLDIAKLGGTLGGGEVTAQGSVVLRPSLRFDIGTAIHGAKILYPQGVRETIDADLRLTGSQDHSALGGTVKIADMSFTPAFDLNSVVSQVSGGVQAPTGQGFMQNLRLNIALNSAGNANLESRTLSVDGSADLQIRGTAAQPVILGRVNLTSGDVILHGSRFVLTGGTVQFINPAMTEPELNVSLTTTIQEYKIDLRFRGSADQMRTQYSSDPSLPQADIINLLAFGQTTEASAMNATPMNQQAESLVASQVASQVTSRISKAAGISQLSISPVLAGGSAEGPPGANLTIQQRVTGNLFVTFSTNVATTQGQTIQGQYKVSPRVTVSATRDPNGGFAVDTLIKKEW
jgi:translocation and assembly module TamB